MRLVTYGITAEALGPASRKSWIMSKVWGLLQFRFRPWCKISQTTLYGDAYHGYWVQNLYALNDHFGSADDLKNLISEVHNRGMYIMVDVVISNMAQAINGTMEHKPQPKIDYSKQKYYHPHCNITNWDDPENYQRCWFGVSLVALPDLDTESSTRQRTW
jgi:alpha-amylase